MLRGTIKVGDDCLPCIYTCCYCACDCVGGAYLTAAAWFDEMLGVEEVAAGLLGPFGDCLDGHEMGEGSVSMLSLFFRFII